AHLEVLDDVVAIEGMEHRLPHAHVLERRSGVFELEVERAHALGNGPGCTAVIALPGLAHGHEGWDVKLRTERDDVDVAREHVGEDRVSVTQELHDAACD